MVTVFQDYQKNLMQRKAVERELEIIGEAMNRLMKLESAPEISEARRVIAGHKKFLGRKNF